MTHRAKLTLGALGVLLASAVAYFVYTNFERVPVQIETGYTGAARRDELLAARRLFEALGAPARFPSYRRGLPPLDGTLVLLDRPDDRNAEQTESILSWVRKGGHAIVIVREDEPDPLLADWDVRLVTREAAQETTSVVLIPGEALQVEFDPNRVLSAAVEESDIHASSYAMSFQLGAGRMTALSDDDLFGNREIDRADNGAFLWRLTHFERGGPVWFVTGHAVSSLWMQLLERGWPLAVSLAALLVAFGWARGTRFGPLHPEPLRTRPQLLDHIRASGAFYWREGAHDVLLDAVRDSVLRTIEYRRPGWLASGDRDERVAALCGLPRERVASAFEPGETIDRDYFREAIATLEHIRKRL